MFNRHFHCVPIVGVPTYHNFPWRRQLAALHPCGLLAVRVEVVVKIVVGIAFALEPTHRGRRWVIIAVIEVRDAIVHGVVTARKLPHPRFPGRQCTRQSGARRFFSGNLRLATAVATPTVRPAEMGGAQGGWLSYLLGAAAGSTTAALTVISSKASWYPQTCIP